MRLHYANTASLATSAAAHLNAHSAARAAPNAPVGAARGRDRHGDQHPGPALCGSGSEARLSMGRVDEAFRSTVAPNALQDGSWELWTLGSLYLLLAVGIGHEFASAARRVGSVRAACATFRGLFFLLAGVLMLLRMLTFWLPIGHEMFWILFVTQYVPYFFQFATYSLVSVFLAKVLLLISGSEPVIAQRLYPGYGASLALLWSIGVVASMLVTALWTPHVRGYGRYVASYGFLVYAMLAALQGVYGVRTRRLLNSVTIGHRRRRRVRLFVVTASVFFALFILISVYNLTYALGINPAHEAFVEWHQSHLPRYWAYLFVLHTVAEVAPVAALLLAFRVLVPPSRDRTPLVNGDGFGSTKETTRLLQRDY